MPGASKNSGVKLTEVKEPVGKAGYSLGQDLPCEAAWQHATLRET